jgi:hypothetical protein
MADSEIQEAASSLFENGLGAVRRNDTQMARILIAVAEKLWEDADDPQNAQKARAVSRTFQR